MEVISNSFLSEISLLSQTNDFPLYLNIDLYLYLPLPFCLSFEKFKHSAFFFLPHAFFSGNDLPSNEMFQMYPQDRVVPVGTNTTFCCVVAEGKSFGSIKYGKTVMKTTRLSRRSYATTVNQGPSNRTGTNVLCYDLKPELKTGAVVFVGCKMNSWMDKNWNEMIDVTEGVGVRCNLLFRSVFKLFQSFLK